MKYSSVVSNKINFAASTLITIGGTEAVSPLVVLFVDEQDRVTAVPTHVVARALGVTTEYQGSSPLAVCLLFLCTRKFLR